MTESQINNPVNKVMADGKPDTDAEMIYEMIGALLATMEHCGFNYGVGLLKDARHHWMQNRNKWENV